MKNSSDFKVDLESTFRAETSKHIENAVGSMDSTVPRPTLISDTHPSKAYDPTDLHPSRMMVFRFVQYLNMLSETFVMLLMVRDPNVWTSVNAPDATGTSPSMVRDSMFFHPFSPVTLVTVQSNPSTTYTFFRVGEVEVPSYPRITQVKLVMLVMI